MTNPFQKYWRVISQLWESTRPFEIEPQRVFLFRAMVMLEYLCNRAVDYRPAEEKDPRVRGIVKDLIGLGLVKVEDRPATCTVTVLGKNTLEAFLARLDDFQKNIEVYRAVDMSTGDFAYERYYTSQISESRWPGYLKDTRWSDMRLLVAAHKKVNRDEAILMMFTRDNQLDDVGEAWKEKIFGPGLLTALEELHNKSIVALDVKSPTVKAEDILKEVIVKGAKLNLKYQIAESLIESSYRTEAVEPPVYNNENYQKYLDDITYLAPCWNSHGDDRNKAKGNS